MAIIYLLIKLFEKQEYADDFMDGKIYMNHIGHFKEYLDNGEMRGDSYEGLTGIFQPGRLSSVRFGDIEFTSADLQGQILIHSKSLEAKNVFCLYSVNTGGYSNISAENLLEFTNSLKVHEQFYGLGKYCVLVTNVTAFLERCEIALQSNGFSYRRGHVEYFDANEYHGMFALDKHGFKKRDIFRHQNEYRIILDKENDDKQPFILDIGSIRDLTILTSIEEYNNNIKFELPEDA